MRAPAPRRLNSAMTGVRAPDRVGAAGSDRVLARLMALHPKIIDLSLDRVWRLLARLGHPERDLPPVVHVAGTNGKGSLLAFLHAMHAAEGRRVHVYTSPHLVRFHERIRLAGTLIPEDDLLALLGEAEAANDGAPITFFEITTCAAFLAFARTSAELLLLETGLGGRLDATNVLDAPALTAITPVSLDHMQYLGPDIASIAGEKAGILKPGVPAVIAPQRPESEAVLAARAEALGAPLSLGGRDWRAWPAADRRSFTFGDTTGPETVYPAPGLLGPVQLDNAALAVACARALPGDLRLSEAAIRAGLARARWPGRLQRLETGAPTAAVPEGWPADWEIWLDGGHNAAAGAALAAACDAWAEADAAQGQAQRPLHLVAGMLNTKAPADFLAPLLARADSLTTVPIPGEPASLNADELAAAARGNGMAAARPAPRIDTAPDVATALGALTRAAPDGPPPRVLICGSLYLAGKVLAANGAASGDVSANA